jgi:hypothetical protein
METQSRKVSRLIRAMLRQVHSSDVSSCRRKNDPPCGFGRPPVALPESVGKRRSTGSSSFLRATPVDAEDISTPSLFASGPTRAVSARSR